MSVWRRQALERFPELARELQLPDGDPMSLRTPYALFGRLLELVVGAHAAGDRPFLVRAYGFAAECARSPSFDVWNAAGVSFYEHLADGPATREGIPEWVPPDVFRNVSPLLRARMRETEFRALLRRYEERWGAGFVHGG